MTASKLGIRKRVFGVLVVIVLVQIALAGRLVWVQLVSGEKYGELALESRLRGIRVESKRGTIYDRNNEVLAMSISADSVYAIPSEVRDPAATARALAPVLGMNYEELLKRLTKQQFHIYLQPKVPASVAKAVRELKLPGIGLEEKSQRYYPHDRLASHLLGFAGADNQGLYGLEVTYEQYLRGKAGRIVVEYDARGQEIPGAMHRYIPPIDGDNLVLTIDRTIQHIAERELAKAVTANIAKKGIILVMDIASGGILAMATKPDFDPNHPFESPAELWRNAAVSDSYEPGSTFKIITLAAALEEKVTREGDRFYCAGSIKIPGSTIRCTRAHGSQSLTEIVENSCNVGFVTLGLRLGQERLYKYLRLFNFGGKTGLDFPGEATGILIPESKVKNVDLARIAFGQAVSVTPLQLVSAVSTVANGGVRYPPHLARRLVNAGGQTLLDFEIAAPQRIISASTAALMQKMLASVVSKGTGRNAALEEFATAGKTGTAQKVIAGRYAPGKYFASFVGFAPADQPLVAILVVLDEPGGASYYGGTIAAPVFRAVVKDVLPYLGVMPRPPVSKQTQGGGAVLVPDVRQQTESQAMADLAASGLSGTTEGSGETVIRQMPIPGAEVAGGTGVILYLGPSDDAAVVPVPDLAGKTPNTSAALLEEAELEFSPTGWGLAVRQDPESGSFVPVGTTIEVYFE